MAALGFARSRLSVDLLTGLFLRGLGAVSSFGFSWIIAQAFGARVVGLYQIGFATATMVATVAVLGLDVMLVRQTSGLLQSGNLAEVAGIYRSSRRKVLLAGSAFATLTALTAFPMANVLIGQPDSAIYILALAPLALLLPWLGLQNALLRCMGLTRLSQSLEGVLYTTFAAAMLGLLLFTDTLPGPEAIPGLLVAGVALSTLVGWRIIDRRFAGLEPVKAEAELIAGLWVATGPVIAAIGSWVLLLIIAAQLGASDAGIFRIAVQICFLMQIVNTSFATMAGPHLSRAAAAGDIKEIRRITITSGTIGGAICAPIAVVAFVAPEWAMSWFGPEFVRGATALQWLAAGQLVDVVAGPVGVALVMQRRERIVLLVQLVATPVGLLSAWLLIPAYGLVGAAVGLFVRSALRNGSNWILVRKSAASPPR